MDLGAWHSAALSTRPGGVTRCVLWLRGAELVPLLARLAPRLVFATARPGWLWAREASRVLNGVLNLPLSFLPFALYWIVDTQSESWVKRWRQVSPHATPAEVDLNAQL
jgi:hypothetical protein